MKIPQHPPRPNRSTQIPTQPRYKRLGNGCQQKCRGFLTKYQRTTGTKLRKRPTSVGTTNTTMPKMILSTIVPTTWLRLLLHTLQLKTVHQRQLLAIVSHKITTPQQLQLHQLKNLPKKTMTYAKHAGGWEKSYVVTHATSDDI